MTLAEYRKKRDFGKTPEPAESRRKPAQNRSRFVIQKHDASRLHYDFRLETDDGALMSWAVPKGLSTDPEEKRLAIQTEDHPLDYIDFEGTIPKGNYGAGTVEVWDIGKYDTYKDIRAQQREGKISFTLHGNRVNGAFSLVKFKSNNQWLLIKSSDEHAKIKSTRRKSQANPTIIQETIEKAEDAEFPRMIKPMLAEPVNEPFDDKDWVFEVKWDGVRALLFQNRSRGIKEIQSRKGSEITHRYPEIAGAIGSAVTFKDSIVLDGEIVVLDKEGIPDFQRHQSRMNVDSKKDIEHLSREAPATFFIFDILYLDGKSLERLDFVERRAILQQVIERGSNRIRISDYIEEDGKALFENAIKSRLEGIVAKYKYSKYQRGSRSSAWLKIKGALTQDCVVIGYTPGEGNRQGYFGSLILAAHHNGKLRFVGHTGSGFGFDQLEGTLEMMQELRAESCPIDHVPYVNRPPMWLRPELVAEVKFNGWTRETIMRAPIFVRFREDKLPDECTIETPKNTEKMVEDEEISEQKFANLEKVFFPSTGRHRELTKGDLIEYYRAVSRYMLPHLRDRPLSLKRYPDGIRGKSFFHKNWTQAKPDYAKTIKVLSESRGIVINYLMCNNGETLLWLANLGCIEMHPWYSRVHDFKSCAKMAQGGKNPALLDEDRCGLATPDFIVFDLDPYIYSGKERRGEEPEYNLKGFRAAVNVALDLKDLFDELGIECYVKTSGKTGLHVFVPVAPIYTYDQTRTFAEIVGKMLAKRNPGRITMEWSVEKRKGRIFFDHNQNARGKTLASIFSARPTESATVSMPVDWGRLAQILPADFTMLTVPDIVKSSGDPWRDIQEKKQDLDEILQRISEAG